LWDRKLVGEKEFAIETTGGVVKSTVFDGGKMVRVDMGRVTFWSNEIPVTGPRREVINEKISVGGKTLTFCAAAIGNPHCVLPMAEISAETTTLLGPLIEIHPNFPNRTNVQFLKVLDRANIQIEIWERGAGHTLASGSSSSAAAAVAHKLGLCDSSITVHMPGGKLAIEIGKEFDVLMTGPVTKVAEGMIDSEIFGGGGRL
jgi:diaminopimelate epimerase